ncbi:MAG: DUF4876 domain-containing protein [Prevotellaceae bacterium]|jgi:hypothetical protein|nr:DUF4876 domain-containing protein [Prevotellaceae bacterium]
MKQKFNVVKSFLYLTVVALMLCYSCTDDNEDYKTYKVNVKLAYPEGFEPVSNVKIKMVNTMNNTSFEGRTDSSGLVTFDVPVGNYEASSSEIRLVEGDVIFLNGVKSGIVITDTWDGTGVVEITLSESRPTPIVIKELYTGGCQPDTGSKVFQRDPYVILYNNSNELVSLENLCFGATNPYNSNASNADYVGGKLFYDNDSSSWIPAATAIWTFRSNVTLEPGDQIVVAMQNAVDNTVTYSNSINFANSKYYCMYDIDQFNNTTYYPSPSEVIPTTNYLKAYRYEGVTANAWTLSVNSPAFFIFIPEGMTPAELATDQSYTNRYNNSSSQVRKKIPIKWILDGVESFRQGAENNLKRLTSHVDVGFVMYKNEQGYTLYRNVNKEATEAIEENAGKIVYGYNLGVEGTQDPSGIDAEASIKNGARIIYMDTNNSSVDFHQRGRASLK